MNVSEIVSYSQKLLPVLIVAGIVSVVFWWVQQLNEPYTYITSDNQRHDADYFMENFVISSINKQGVLRHRLKGVYAAHYPDTDTTEVDHPQLITFEDEKELWTIDAPKGIVSSDQNEISLRGVVHIKKPNRDGSVLKLETSELFINLESQQAHTDQRVIIENNNGVTHALGMHTDLLNENVKLLKDVKGKYTLR